jgi:hypothetical protein
VDLALKSDGAIRFLVEVKSAGTVLREKHTEQAQNYAANSNIRWVLLTKRIAWKLYHLTFEERIQATLAFSVDLAEGVTDKGSELLALFHEQAIRKGELDSFWEHRVAQPRVDRRACSPRRRSGSVVATSDGARASSSMRKISPTRSTKCCPPKDGSGSGP